MVFLKMKERKFYIAKIIGISVLDASLSLYMCGTFVRITGVSKSRN